MCASELKRTLGVCLQGLALAVVCGLLSPAHAQSDKEQEQIKRLRLQIRQLQQEQASSQQAQSRADKGRAEAEQALKSLQADVGQQKTAAAQSGRRATALASELQGVRDENARLRQQLEQAAATLQAQQAEAQRQQGLDRTVLADAQAQRQALETRHAQCRTDNAALYGLGTELLHRYETKGVAEALAVQEPFFQMARVRLENTAAQYRDKLDAARFKEPSASVDARP